MIYLPKKKKKLIAKKPQKLQMSLIKQNLLPLIQKFGSCLPEGSSIIMAAHARWSETETTALCSDLRHRMEVESPPVIERYLNRIWIAWRRESLIGIWFCQSSAGDVWERVQGEKRRQYGLRGEKKKNYMDG